MQALYMFALQRTQVRAVSAALLGTKRIVAGSNMCFAPASRKRAFMRSKSTQRENIRSRAGDRNHVVHCGVVGRLQVTSFDDQSVRFIAFFVLVHAQHPQRSPTPPEIKFARPTWIQRVLVSFCWHGEQRNDVPAS